MGRVTRAFGDLLDAIDQLDEEGTIFIREGPIEDSSEAVVISQGQEPPPGFKYLLEVFLAKEVLGVWSKLRSGKKPSRADRCEAVAYYASHDAYLPM